MSRVRGLGCRQGRAIVIFLGGKEKEMGKLFPAPTPSLIFISIRDWNNYSKQILLAKYTSDIYSSWRGKNKLWTSGEPSDMIIAE